MAKELLDELDQICRIDMAGMLGVVERTPEMLAEIEKIIPVIPFKKVGKIGNIVIAGMGGSAIAGDIAAELLTLKCSVPINVCRGYLLPAYVDPSTLFIATSYSGDTEEVLTLLKEAEKKKAKIACITSGGKLKEIAEKNKYPLFVIPGGFQPRAALPFILVPLFRIFEKLGFYPSLPQEIKEAIALLKDLKNEYNSQNPLRTNPVKQLAKKLAGKTPIIFGSVGTTNSAALRFKDQFNENGKITALNCAFPELNHNDIVNFAALKRGEHNFSLIILRDSLDGERIKKRIEITKSIISSSIGGVNEIFSQGRGMFAKAMSLVLFADFLSVYSALLKEVDPSRIDPIIRLKKEMSR
ncbi:MAG: bifunctional phosphoglucose/phosphomannose isomerase [Candidatus Margulisiibacteriota bacterium]